MPDTVQRAQIERRVSYNPEAIATFIWNGEWIVKAWPHPPSGPIIQTDARMMTDYYAMALSVAIQMALEWIAEEQAKRTPAVEAQR